VFEQNGSSWSKAALSAALQFDGSARIKFAFETELHLTGSPETNILYR
jgi:hypothetical protein